MATAQDLLRTVRTVRERVEARQQTREFAMSTKVTRKRRPTIAELERAAKTLRRRIAALLRRIDDGYPDGLPAAHWEIEDALVNAGRALQNFDSDEVDAEDTA